MKANFRLLVFISLLVFPSMNLFAQDYSGPKWISTTDESPWIQKDITSDKSQSSSTIEISLDNTAQTIDGFGACFNELGWDALNLVSYVEKQDILQSFFNQVSGAKIQHYAYAAWCK